MSKEYTINDVAKEVKRLLPQSERDNLLQDIEKKKLVVWMR